MNISIVQTVSELPDFQHSRNLFVDLETTSGSPTETSINPWMNCEICGVCITADSCETSYYVPVAHNVTGTFKNLERGCVIEWLELQFRTAGRWINHNIKYDVHALNNSFGIDVLQYHLDLTDTLTLAKLVDSDRFFYGLKALNKAWLHDDSDYEKELDTYKEQSKDFGDIPIDKLGVYGAYDVIVNRRLYKYCIERLPHEVYGVWETEQKLTKILIEIERNGLHVNSEELKFQDLYCRAKMVATQEVLHERSGYAPFDPNSDVDCYEALIAELNWPKLEKTVKGKVSFNKQALEKYTHDPRADTGIVKLLKEYRKWSMLYGLYVAPFQALQVNGLLHPFYNQCVRTGRMSCSMPNAQQQSKDSKKLIHPPPGQVFISSDFSQIEFRIIAHYLKTKAVIAEYQRDPNADFHQLIADMCGIDRKPAKNINFATAFGGGKRKILSMLAAEPSLAEGFDDTLGMSYQHFCKQRAESVFEQYHDMLPELKPTSYRAQLACKKRARNGAPGYVFNLYGRRRHLPVKAAYRAFNTIVQSCAADLMKERIVALYDQLPSDIKMVGNVHDEVLFTADERIARDPEVKKLICDTMNSPTVELSIPIRSSYGIGTKNWGEIEEI